MKNLPENVRLIINSVLPLLVVSLLFVFSAKFGIAKISDVRGQISAANNDKATLTQKLNLLQSVSTTVGPVSKASASALPDKNTSLIVFSQVKTLAVEGGISITNIKSGAEIKDASGLSRVDITFDAEAPRPAIIAFLTSFDKIAPIVLVDQIKLSESAGTTRANVVLKSFWAPFPSKLPTLTDKITDLTTSETDVLNRVTALTPPQFLEVPAAQAGGKVDPFAP